jgi:hypothetical protein
VASRHSTSGFYFTRRYHVGHLAVPSRLLITRRGYALFLQFSNVHMWGDGCCADFKCATLLLWLSTISANTNGIWHWNWFCSCHGKTDECDAGGGALKRAVDVRVFSPRLFR